MTFLDIVGTVFGVVAAQSVQIETDAFTGESSVIHLGDQVLYQATTQPAGLDPAARDLQPRGAHPVSELEQVKIDIDDKKTAPPLAPSAGDRRLAADGARARDEDGDARLPDRGRGVGAGAVENLADIDPWSIARSRSH